MENVPDKNEKLIGATMPLSFDSYLNLYAFSRSQQKTKIIRKVLRDFWESTESMVSVGRLMSEIALQKQFEWQKMKVILKSDQHSDRHYEFLQQVREELIKKGIALTHVESILQNINV